MPNYDADRAAASLWAKNLLDNPDGFCVLDSETSGLLNRGPVEVLQLGILNGDGTTALDSLVRPDWASTGMTGIPADSTAIHGITDEMVKDAPTLLDLLPRMAEIMHGKTVVVYNVAYDFEVMLHCLFRRYEQEEGPDYRYEAPSLQRAAIGSVPRLKAYQWLNAAETWECAMLQFAAWYGEPGRYGGYRWQKLQGGDHSAIGDCKACYELIRLMAGEA